MDITVVITIILGFATCISPPIVALINNLHAQKLRKMELSANESLKKNEWNAETRKQLSYFKYEAKYKAYHNFIAAASKYIFDYKNPAAYSNIISAYSDCKLNGATVDMEGYMQYVLPPPLMNDLNEHQLEQMRLFLVDYISPQLNEELENTLQSIFE